MELLEITLTAPRIMEKRNVTWQKFRSMKLRDSLAYSEGTRRRSFLPKTSVLVQTGQT